ncbi:Hypp8514 [Branchiostoma lanceolatum]|uniref:Hypp8514 protein n=1 Tax=Branchiostoma lanceolatum TaxID=7740 RepID=A0A8K0EHJ0_BRALA|nr:Hypp8514 [Branchiostoma lanceolatum]
MSTTEKESSQMAQSGHNKACRPLPPIPYQGFSTEGLGEFFADSESSSPDHEDPGTHMYHYIDKDEVNMLRPTGQQRKQDGQPAMGTTEPRQRAQSGPNKARRPLPPIPKQDVTSAEPSQMENSGHSKAHQPLPPLPHEDVSTGDESKTGPVASTDCEDDPDISDSHMYTYVDKDDINNPQPPADDTKTDSTAPKTTHCNIPGFADNGMYVPGALRQETNDTANSCGFSTRCKMAFHRPHGYIIIAIVVVAFLGTGAGIIERLIATPGGQADINMPFAITDQGKWATARPVTSTNVTATYIPVTLTKPAFGVTNTNVSATRLHLTTSMFPPSPGEATTPASMAITTAQGVTAGPTKTTTTLPQLATTLPQLTTTLPRKNNTATADNQTATADNHTATGYNRAATGDNHIVTDVNYAATGDNYTATENNYTATGNNYITTNDNLTATGDNYTARGDNYAGTDDNYTAASDNHTSKNDNCTAV